MKRSVAVAVRMAVVTIVLTGVIYPLLVTGVAGLLFPGQASGSLISVNGKVVGSSLIAQGFVGDSYFHPRPSAAGAQGYDGSASGASNLGPTNRRLIESVKGRVQEAGRREGTGGSRVPVDMVTSSASGLDPHISPDAAAIQVARVAQARGVSEARVRALVAQHTAGRQFGFLGEPRVNVLELNLALDGARID